MPPPWWRKSQSEQPRPFGQGRVGPDRIGPQVGSGIREEGRADRTQGQPPVQRPPERHPSAQTPATSPLCASVLGIEVNGKLPEKVAIKEPPPGQAPGAPPSDMVGDVAKRTLRIFNGSFKTIARTATRLEQATELGHSARGRESVAAKAGRSQDAPHRASDRPSPRRLTRFQPKGRPRRAPFFF